MPNSIISALTADTNPAATDLVATVDVSDTTDAASGTTKKCTLTNLNKGLPAFTGDSGSGGVKGSVPAPGAGDAAANKYLDAAGGFSVPPSGSPSGSAGGALGGTYPNPTVKVSICIAVSDETTAITTGTEKITFRMPHAMTITDVRASLSTASSSGTPTVDINESGSTILSTKITIDVSEKTSTTAATAPVISDSALADDAEITIDIDVAGTGAKGLKVYLIGTRA